MIVINHRTRSLASVKHLFLHMSFHFFFAVILRTNVVFGIQKKDSIESRMVQYAGEGYYEKMRIIAIN